MPHIKVSTATLHEIRIIQEQESRRTGYRLTLEQIVSACFPGNGQSSPTGNSPVKVRQ